MKKTKETDRKYITVDEGIGFRKIAQIMSRHNFDMNHATARNHFVLALHNFLVKLSTQLTGETPPASQVEELLKNQGLHSQLGDVLHLAVKDDLDGNVLNNDNLQKVKSND